MPVFLSILFAVPLPGNQTRPIQRLVRRPALVVSVPVPEDTQLIDRLFRAYEKQRVGYVDVLRDKVRALTDKPLPRNAEKRREAKLRRGRLLRKWRRKIRALESQSDPVFPLLRLRAGSVGILGDVLERFVVVEVRDGHSAIIKRLRPERDHSGRLYRLKADTHGLIDGDVLDLANVVLFVAGTTKDGHTTALVLRRVSRNVTAVFRAGFPRPPGQGLSRVPATAKH